MQRLGLLAGIGLATLGTLGVAGSGILWNFQGRTLGLSSTITSLVLLAISLVLLRPLPSEPFDIDLIEISDLPATTPASSTIRLKRPQTSLIGITLAGLGTFGLAGSGILWNFQGVAFGLSGTLTSVVAILLSIPFLWPIGSRNPAQPITIQLKNKSQPVDTTEARTEPEFESTPGQIPAPEPDSDVAVTETDVETTTPSNGVLTTAEAIAAELAAAQEQAAPVELVTFAPQNLAPGGTLPSRKRRPGASMKGYQGMVEDLFRS